MICYEFCAYENDIYMVVFWTLENFKNNHTKTHKRLLAVLVVWGYELMERKFSQLKNKKGMINHVKTRQGTIFKR